MANKKITDLQLRSSVTDSLNFPSDDGIQSYRVTAAQIFSYLCAKFVAATAKTAPIAADILTIFDSAASNAVKKITVANLRNSVYRAVTTTDSVGADDDTMKLSGASFVSTLPTAVGVAGKRYKFIHAGTSISQVYTINTTSSQTINGNASGDYKLYCKGEVLTVESDGANWVVLSYYFPPSESYTPTIPSAAFGTASAIDFKFSRRGSRIRVDGVFTAGTTAGGTAYVTLPGSLTAKTSTDIVCGMWGNANPPVNVPGFMVAGNGSNSMGFAIGNIGQNSFGVIAGSNVASANKVALWFECEVTGWVG